MTLRSPPFRRNFLESRCFWHIHQSALVCSTVSDPEIRRRDTRLSFSSTLREIQ